VLYFEGERGHQFRILRAVKNRFGSADEIGVFEMTDTGLSQVQNPSALFIAERENGISGASIFSGIEGSRPMLVEIQALTALTAFSTPRRAVIGWDTNRLSMVLAVLEARCGLSISGHDIYLNVVGGLRISEPAADLAVAAALISSITDIPVPAEVVFFGELGLSGEIRRVTQSGARVKEAQKLGFNLAIAPKAHLKSDLEKKENDHSLAVMGINHLMELLTYIRVEGEKMKKEYESEKERE
jgi:DNA repair protein RadA/Sms